jgi:3-dehydroquinate synthase
MEIIEVATKHHTYNVFVGLGLRFQIGALLPKSYSSILIVTDDNVERLNYLQDVKSGLENFSGNIFSYVIPNGEQSKSMEQYTQLQSYCLECGLDRHSLIIALGGGVVGDLAGFVAATYMRGIDYIQVPTTILAHDSSVGGKVAINHPLSKNLIGSFYQPQGVIYDLETLYSLPIVEIRSGFAEIIKHACISNKDFLNQLMINISSLDNLPVSIIQNAIVEGIKIKAKIVEQDEQEKGVRSFLNFGHTLGHAIEGELGYGQITHGEAVSIGMGFASLLSKKLLQFSYPENLITWLKTLQYPFKVITKLSVENLLERMKKDKKNKDGQIRMVLLKEIGQPQLIPIREEKIKEELIQFIKEVEKFD